VVTEHIRKQLEEVIEQDSESWKRQMIHHLKEENPEINSLLLDIAQKSQDPKSVIIAGYMIYKVIELAQEEENAEALQFED
jgi:hypothetical protein